MTEQPPQLPFQIFVPEDLQAGVYANGLSIWFSPHEFTFDFGVTLPQELVTADDGSPAVRNVVRVVSRVKVPPGQVFEIIRAINEALSQYEASYGQLLQPTQPPSLPAAGRYGGQWPRRQGAVGPPELCGRTGSGTDDAK